MRQRISLLFYCLASVVIILQIGTSFIAISSDSHQQSILHSVSRQVESPAGSKEHHSAPKVDFRQMAKDLTQEKY
ncbi:hypothetical protein RJ45_19230 [Photobacterium gaetbulicola]|uniref:Uncharacterized protein n=1 Tax=Photobacterium gaetbulicola TaxID=1295392 RepID=A0A0B9FZW7_9GAMM|nr:hypothetical protein [Photobacterium gaetbulicola]KHT62058.1 hypothetical protein RJ45_19230 [Photobacterium gaetbulicola]